MGTVGRNLANGDPGNDHPATMLAYGAEIVAIAPNGERVIPITSQWKEILFLHRGM